MESRPFIVCQPPRLLEDFRNAIESGVHRRRRKQRRNPAEAVFLGAMQTAFNNSIEGTGIAPLALKINNEVLA